MKHDGTWFCCDDGIVEKMHESDVVVSRLLCHILQDLSIYCIAIILDWCSLCAILSSVKTSTEDPKTSTSSWPLLLLIILVCLQNADWIWLVL